MYKNNNKSKLIHYFIFLVLVLFFLFISYVAEIFGLIYSALVLTFIASKYSYVLSLDENKIKVVRWFFFKEEIKISDIVHFSYKEFGYSRSRSKEFVFYYKNKKKQLKHVFLIHYLITGNDNIVDLMNFLNGKVKILNESFEPLNIVFEDGVYKKKQPVYNKF